MKVPIGRLAADAVLAVADGLGLSGGQVLHEMLRFVHRHAMLGDVMGVPVVPAESVCQVDK